MLARLPIDASGENSLYGGRQPQLRERTRDFDYAVAYQRAFIEQRLKRLLDKKRIALGALDYNPLEGISVRRRAQQRSEHFAGGLLIQSFQPQL